MARMTLFGHGSMPYSLALLSGDEVGFLEHPQERAELEGTEGAADPVPPGQVGSWASLPDTRFDGSVRKIV